jgi:hypothetical protein
MGLRLQAMEMIETIDGKLFGIHVSSKFEDQM